MSRTQRAAVVVACLLLAVAAPAHESTERLCFPPLDEAPWVAELVAFRKELIRAVAARDGDAVLQHVHPDLRPRLALSLNATTMRQLGGQDHENWLALERVLPLGGRFLPLETALDPPPAREFCAPYTSSAYPAHGYFPDRLIGEDDPWVILARNVPVYARPPKDMRILARLDYDFVRLASPPDQHAGAPPDWIGIKTPDGRVGYVAASLIMDPDYYHVCFGEFNGTWLITRLERGIVGRIWPTATTETMFACEPSPRHSR